MLMSADSSDCSITKLPITSVIRVQVPSATQSALPSPLPSSAAALLNNDCSRSSSSSSIATTPTSSLSATSPISMSNQQHQLQHQQQSHNSRSLAIQCNQYNNNINNNNNIHQQSINNTNRNTATVASKKYHSIQHQQQCYPNDTTIIKVKSEPTDHEQLGASSSTSSSSSSLPSSSTSSGHHQYKQSNNNSCISVNGIDNHIKNELTVTSRKIPHSNVIYVNSSRSRSPTPTSSQSHPNHHPNHHHQQQNHHQEQLLLPPPPPPPPLQHMQTTHGSGPQNPIMGPPASNIHNQHYSDIHHHHSHHAGSSQSLPTNRCNSLNNLYANNNNNCANNNNGNNNYHNNKLLNNNIKYNNGNSSIMINTGDHRESNVGCSIRERSNSLGCIVVSTSADYNNCNSNNNNNISNRSLSNSTISLNGNNNGHHQNHNNNNNNNGNYNINNNSNNGNFNGNHHQDNRPQTPEYIKSYPVMDTTVASSIKGEPDLNIEFDGTTVLCRVCGDKASGFHYGVHSCEGCKGFFRRSIQQKIQYRPCTKNQQCSILRINRNRCQYCRLKKCIAVGMSRDAVRFGRVPKREKARILAAMQQSTQNRGQQRQLATELDDQPRLLAAVLRAHMETCEFTKEKVSAMRQRARDCPSYSMPTLLACPLNPAPELQSEQEFSERFAHVIRGVIDFAGMIPGFQLLNQDDKFTLLKAGLFDALFVRLICMFDSSINSIICLNGQVMRRDAIQNGANARFLVDSTFNFAERMNSMNLSDAEIGLFCAIVLITPDRPGLRNIELIDKMHSRLKGCLQTIINQSRPDQPEFMSELLQTLPDLRTLSTLHTEKLVVFRTEHKELLRQQMWQMDDDQPSKSPGSSGSNWDDRDRMIDDMAKSPMGSVSSTESGDIGEYSPQHHHHHHYHGHNHHHHHAHQSSLASSAPLLAATLSGTCPLRNRANSGSSAEDIDVVVGSHAHLTQNGLTITPVARSHSTTGTTHLLHHHLSNGRYRKLDSPTDSGIESGNEKAESTKTVSSGGGSSCSSPRSSVDDALDAEAVAHVTNGHSTTAATTTNSGMQNSTSSINNGATKRQIVEDMPVLKRVLQAPPLYDTNSLMDEAYKPHKKFRALRHRDYDNSENDPHTTSTTGNNCSSNSSATSTTTPPTVQITPAGHSTSPSPNTSQQTTTTSSSSSSSSPTNVSQNIPSSSPINQQQSQLHMHLTRNLNTTNNSTASSSNTNNNNNNSINNYNHHNSNNLSTTSSASPATVLPPQIQPQQQQQQHSSLSSTHSVLAKSLMAEPRMTPEQIKRSDIIQNYIMRGSSSSPNPNGLIASNNSNSSPSQSTHHHHLNHYQSSASPLLIGNAPSSPSTTTVTLSSPPPPSHQQSAQQQQHTMRWQGQSVITTTTLRQQSVSPHSNSSSCSNGSTTNSSYFQSPHSTSVSPPRPSPSATHSPRLVELQVDIADSQQPLNLSKKSPTPPPPPPPSTINNQTTTTTTTSAQHVQQKLPAVLVAHKYPSVSPDVTVTATKPNCPQVTVSPASSPATTIHKVLLEA